MGNQNEISFDGRKVLIVGDSITDGGTYVSHLLFLLGRLRPSWRIGRIASIGLGSETVSGLSEARHPFPRPCLHERLERALTKFQPEILIACYGMNDGIYNPQSPARMKAYKDGIGSLLEKARAHGVEQIILMTPPPFDPAPVANNILPATASPEEFSYMNPFEGYAAVLEDYAGWLLTLKGPGLAVVDLNSVMKSALREGVKTDHKFKLSEDGIHPGPFGHLLIALALLKTIGVDAGGKTPAALLKDIEADPAFAICDERRKALSEAWRAFIGFTRENTVRREAIDDVLKTFAWG